MNYPNPGDFAVVVGAGEGKIDQSNLAKKVFVEAFYSPRTAMEQLMQTTRGQLVLVTTLEAFWIRTDSGRQLVGPASGIIMPRNLLRKIEPLCTPDADYETLSLRLSKELSHATP